MNGMPSPGDENIFFENFFPDFLLMQRVEAISEEMLDFDMADVDEEALVQQRNRRANEVCLVYIPAQRACAYGCRWPKSRNSSRLK